MNIYITEQKIKSSKIVSKYNLSKMAIIDTVKIRKSITDEKNIAIIKNDKILTFLISSTIYKKIVNAFDKEYNILYIIENLNDKLLLNFLKVCNVISKYKKTKYNITFFTDKNIGDEELKYEVYNTSIKIEKYPS